MVGRQTWLRTPRWFAPSDRQLEDARSVLIVQGDLLDCDYLRRWARELSVEELLNRLVEET